MPNSVKSINLTKDDKEALEAPWWKTTYFEVHYEHAEQVDKYSERFSG